MSTSKKSDITDAMETIRDGIVALAKDEKDAPQPSPDDDFVQSIDRWSAYTYGTQACVPESICLPGRPPSSLPHSPEKIYNLIVEMSAAGTCVNSVVTYADRAEERGAGSLVVDLKATLDVIIKCVNDSGVLVGWCLNAYILIHQESVSSILYLRKNPEENAAVITPKSVGKGVPWRGLYAKAAAKWEDGVTTGRIANGAGIESTIGWGSGSFLFALQMLLIETIGTKRFDLPNYTDSPVRAALGIYSQLRFNGPGNSKDLGEWTNDATGDMHWTRSSIPSSPEKKQAALDHLETLIHKARTTAGGDGTSIWSTDADSVNALMYYLKTLLPDTIRPVKGASAGGRRRRRKYTKRNRRKRPKTRRRRTRR